ncbi:acyl-CoA dehydrogenase family protein [Aestuariivirga sp. YIM B02566]|uniref:Acyl-CoA dehydrogenase family protein n=1 Tax=Taklimakanibacter albus TaxID=2800327 RepID=A0ACC5R710_9HYPH|nr:acyl-CoA dehydrogenase family protein [Aestuariivirga sp. YIM B02566]MBK1868352.1 acyl-CoA dehydrogenase family protein [Aestuariivirga sp. YIM B02566]
MDFALTDDQAQIRDMVRGFAAEKIAPYAAQWENEKAIPRQILKEAAELGLAAITVREESGGSGLSRVESVLIFEELSYADPVVASFLSIHNMCAWMIDSYGSTEQRQVWLPKLCAMEQVASYCLTEPSSGSDAAALKTKAVKDGNSHYRLTGSKAFISGGGYSDLYLVMCRTGEEGPKGISCILVETGTEGLSFGANERKMGWHAQATAMVNLDQARVPATHLIGAEGQGFSIAMNGLNGGRLNIAACSLGAAQSALDKALAYMKERKAFGRNLAQFQALQFKIADMETELQAARVFLYHAAWKLSTNAPDARKFCAMAKRLVTDTGFRVANEALQIHGGYGYLADFGIEKIVRDLRVHQILEGTNEIMRLIVARDMLGGD